MTLAADEILLTYTDGITDACNAADEDFGETRLKRIVFVYRVIQRECGLKTVRNRECQGSRRGDLGWTVGFTRIVSMVTVRQ